VKIIPMSAYVIQPWYGVVEKLAKVSRMITEYIIGLPAMLNKYNLKY
jgi:hypothetical protein